MAKTSSNTTVGGAANRWVPPFKKKNFGNSRSQRAMGEGIPVAPSGGMTQPSQSEDQPDGSTMMG